MVARIRAIERGAISKRTTAGSGPGACTGHLRLRRSVSRPARRDRIREDRDLDAPVLAPTLVLAVAGDGLRLAAARGADARARDALAGDEPRGRQRPPVRQVHVVRGAALRI